MAKDDIFLRGVAPTSAESEKITVQAFSDKAEDLHSIMDIDEVKVAGIDVEFAGH